MPPPPYGQENPGIFVLDNLGIMKNEARITQSYTGNAFPMQISIVWLRRILQMAL